MKYLEYSIERVSYKNHKDRRILKTCLANWFKSPKALNFVAPSMSFPFSFSIWLNYYKKFSGISTFIAKHNNWIVGHISIRIDEDAKVAHLFHLFIAHQHRKKGLGEKMIQIVEEHVLDIGVTSFSLYLVPKNEPAKMLYTKLGYKKDGINHLGFIKYLKTKPN